MWGFNYFLENFIYERILKIVNNWFIGKRVVLDFFNLIKIYFFFDDYYWDWKGIVVLGSWLGIIYDFGMFIGVIFRLERFLLYKLVKKNKVGNCCFGFLD